MSDYPTYQELAAGGQALSVKYSIGVTTEGALQTLLLSIRSQCSPDRRESAFATKRQAREQRHDI
jgi:hypothetical protein